MAEKLKLIALEPEDLVVVSAHLEDTRVKASDMVFQSAERRFVMVGARRVGEVRRPVGVRFEQVSRVRTRRFDPGSGEVRTLLSTVFTPHDKPGGIVTFFFEGGAAVQIEVACLEAAMTDLD